ncbi:MAG TPA: hypothetical protein VF221_17675 [Chloroflexota bacterium]
MTIDKEAQWIIRVRDRGRTLAWHRLDRADEAFELQHVYGHLGYATDKIVVERVVARGDEAA